MLQHRALCKFHVTDGQNTRDQIKRVKSHVRDHIAFGIFHSFLVEVQKDCWLHTTWRLELLDPLVARNYLYISAFPKTQTSLNLITNRVHHAFNKLR